MRNAIDTRRWLRTEAAVELRPNAAERYAGWHRRIRAFAGRSLSHLALEAEQEERGGRLALRGQMLTPGVVAGLEVDVDRTDAVTLRLGAGFGVAASGEDVTLARELVVDARKLLVWGTRNPEEPKSVDVALEAFVGPLDALVLALVPAEIHARGDFDGGDPCEYDPETDAFADHQRVDAALPVWVRLPSAITAEAGPAQRNRLAHAIFAAENDARWHDADSPEGMRSAHPWDELGVPLALVGFAADRTVRFVDRHAVTRRGGKARPRATPLVGRGSPPLWQARIDQLSDQLFDLLTRGGATGAGATPAEVRAAIAHGPPAGVLPLQLVENLTLPSRRQLLFPAHFRVEWAPIPIEQLDAAISMSAPLSRLDLDRTCTVRVLVPVPQDLYDPRLLVTDEPDNEALEEAVANLLLVVRQRRSARDQLLDQRAEVEQMLGGSDAITPAPDDPEEEGGGDATVPPLDVNLEAERTTWRNGVKKLLSGQQAKNVLDAEINEGLRGVRDMLRRLADRADDRIDFGFLRVHTDIYRSRQILVGGEKAASLATSPALANIVQGTTAYAASAEVQAIFNTVKRDRTPPTPEQPEPIVRPPERPVVRAAVDTAFRDMLVPGVKFPSAGEKLPIGGFELPTIKRESIFGGLPLPDLREEITTPLPFVAPALSRTVSIAERLAEAPSKVAKTSAKSTKYELIESILAIPGLDPDDVVVDVPLAENGQLAGSAKVPLRDLTPEKIGQLAGLEDLLEPADLADDALQLSRGVRMLDDTIGLLRQIELKVAGYRRALGLTEALIAKLEAALSSCLTRIRNAQEELDEARHDLGVGRALAEEERARLVALEERRKAVLRDHVRFVAFVRPRTADASDDLPSRDLESPEELPVPACFNEAPGEVPREIRMAVDIVRRAPIEWLPPWHWLLDALDDHASLSHVVTAALAPAPLPALVRKDAAPLPLAAALEGGLTAMSAQVELHRQATPLLDVAALPAFGWRELHTEARSRVSLADFVHVGHIKPLILAGSTLAVDRMTRIATCLYRRVARVKPEVRLAWAQQVSVFDRVGSLRDLAVLDGFAELEEDARSEMQALCDWLFAQVARPAVLLGLWRGTSGEPLVTNLVRVCILLACHAPVHELLRGKVKRAPIQLGGLVRIEGVDVTRARVGMHALLGEGIAHAVVDDIAEDHVLARIVARGAAIELPDDAPAVLSHPEEMPAIASKVLGRTPAAQAPKAPARP
jgi:hypothetical protein